MKFASGQSLIALRSCFAARPTKPPWPKLLLSEMKMARRAKLADEIEFAVREVQLLRVAIDQHVACDSRTIGHGAKLARGLDADKPEKARVGQRKIMLACVRCAQRIVILGGGSAIGALDFDRIAHRVRAAVQQMGTIPLMWCSLPRSRRKEARGQLAH